VAHGSYALAIPRGTRRALALVAIALAATTALGVLLLRPTGDVDLAEELNLVSRIYDAKVLHADDVPCEGTRPSDDVDCVEFRFRLSQGPDRGETITLELPETPALPDLDPGDRVVLSYDPDADPGFRYQYADRQRRPVLFWLVALFALAVILLGRFRGLAALVGLGASVVVILVFVLPAILDGRSPVLVAIAGASTIAFLALYLAHGFGPKTTVALLGTLASLALTVVLAAVFTSLAEFTGLGTEEASLLTIGAEKVDLAGLVLGGMVIGALGALDDMTVTQASAVWELRATNPRLSQGALSRSALRIGRDHVASTVNTLALAYAGAALPLLILFVQSRQSLGAVANSETVAIEIVRTLVGSIGLVASVPLTTWLAARVATAQEPPTRRPTPGAPRPVAPVAPPGRPEPERPVEEQFWGRRFRDSGSPPDGPAG